MAQVSNQPRKQLLHMLAAAALIFIFSAGYHFVFTRPSFASGNFEYKQSVELKKKVEDQRAQLQAIDEVIEEIR